MLVQLALGSALILLTMAVCAGSWLLLEWILLGLRDWVRRPPYALRLMVVLLITILLTLLMMTVAVWIWALALRGLGIFATLEASVYFALVAFTTLGFGDVLLPVEWQLLGGLSAANGLLLFGFLTAMLVETLRVTRLRQRDAWS